MAARPVIFGKVGPPLLPDEGSRCQGARPGAPRHGREYHGKPGQVMKMKKHCDRIAELNEELAAQYEDLAKGEDAAAKQ